MDFNNKGLNKLYRLLFSLLNRLKNDCITFQSLRLHLKMTCFSPKTKIYLVHNKRNWQIITFENLKE